jgi:hypothetical protein
LPRGARLRMMRAVAVQPHIEAHDPEHLPEPDLVD